METALHHNAYWQWYVERPVWDERSAHTAAAVGWQDELIERVSGRAAEVDWDEQEDWDVAPPRPAIRYTECEDLEIERMLIDMELARECAEQGLSLTPRERTLNRNYLRVDTVNWST